MSVEYFHPKTTPNTPIRRAVRMSVALPGQSTLDLIIIFQRNTFVSITEILMSKQ